LRPQMKSWTEIYSVCSGKSTSTTALANPRLARTAYYDQLQFPKHDVLYEVLKDRRT